MRLIDADALLEEIQKVCFSSEWAKFRADYGSHGQCDYIINYIENASTEEPKIIPIANITFDEEKLREIVNEAVEQIKFENCKAKETEIDNEFMEVQI